MGLIKVHGPLCMPASTAMLFDTTVEEVVSFLGHDGLAVVDDKYQGIHVQELQRFALSKGYVLALYEPMPNLEGRLVDCWKDGFPLEKFDGLLLGETAKGANHCVAWVGGEMLNPTSSELVGLHQFWAKVKMS